MLIAVTRVGVLHNSLYEVPKIDELIDKNHQYHQIILFGSKYYLSSHHHKSNYSYGNFHLPATKVVLELGLHHRHSGGIQKKIDFFFLFKPNSTTLALFYFVSPVHICWGEGLDSPKPEPGLAQLLTTLNGCFTSPHVYMYVVIVFPTMIIWDHRF